MVDFADLEEQANWALLGIPKILYPLCLVIKGSLLAFRHDILFVIKRPLFVHHHNQVNHNLFSSKDTID